MKLGDRVEDTISGFKGIIVARTEWLYGCMRLTVQPEKSKDGKVPDSHTFDEPQLKLLKAGVVKWKVATPATYGPRDDKAALSRQ